MFTSVEFDHASNLRKCDSVSIYESVTNFIQGRDDTAGLVVRHVGDHRGQRFFSGLVRDDEFRAKVGEDLCKEPRSVCDYEWNVKFPKFKKYIILPLFQCFHSDRMLELRVALNSPKLPKN